MNNRIIKFSVLALALAFVIAGFAFRRAEAATVAADGATVFNTKCAGCHGKDGKGTAMWKSKGQPDFSDAAYQKGRTDAQIADSIRNGKGRFMPAFKEKLSDDEINAVTAQVRGFGKK